MAISKTDAEDLCLAVPPFSWLIRKDIETQSHIARLENILLDLKAGNKVPADAHLLSGAGEFKYNFEANILILEETALFHPNPSLERWCGAKVGTMTGVIVHCYDPVNNLYAIQKRGGADLGAGKIQSAAAGFGKYREHMADTALRELKEETGISGELVFPYGMFLDMASFSVYGYAQLLFSYIASADLAGLKYFTKVSEIKRLKTNLEKEVSHVFAVPLLRLEQMLEPLNSKIGFYGPIEKSIKSFIKWHAKN